MTAIVKPSTLPVREEVCGKSWTDENTGKRVRQLVDLPKGSSVNYFRFPRHLPGGWMLAWGEHEHGNLLTIEPESGRVRLIPADGARWGGRLRESDGRLFIFKDKKRELWAIDLVDGPTVGKPFMIASWPKDVPGDVTDITCDGKTLLFHEVEQDLAKHPIPTTKDVGTLWHYFNRPRNGRIWAHNIETGSTTKVHEIHGIAQSHIDASPADPTLIRFCLDMYDAYGQRTWTIRLDGSDLKPIRKQEHGELVTHEFWWGDPNYIGYTFQDRRGDATMETLPWAEYSPRATHLGIADLSGREVYLSDPLNSYHSHIFRSEDGKWVCGEGTEGNSFAFAARFSMSEKRVEMKAMATIHTPYIPFRGQGVETGFSIDGKWLIFNDEVNGHRQVCAVELD